MKVVRFYLLLFALIASSESFSQRKGVGLKAGYNVSRIEGADIDAMEWRIGYQAGIQSNMKISNRIYFGPDIVWIQKGTEYLELFYFKSPLYWKYYLTDKMHFDFGPYAAYLFEANSMEKPIESEFQTLDLGGSFGIGGYIGSVNIDLKFHRGFKDVQKDESVFLIPKEGEVDAANSTIEFSLGYLF